mmetsp:Transcript_22055/g.52115  ORF Transcript_22055/g.52115 Transcript_22055/m.52115 type:complete len:326 (-) Transcript_22055:62-1039(-)
MPSLTPQKHASATVYDAMLEGFITAGLTAVPTSLILYTCMRSSPSFVKSTNWSSRTAMAIMPPLFAFAWGAEVCRRATRRFFYLTSPQSKLVHSMHSMANQAEHSKQIAEWSHEHILKEHRKELKRMTTQKILAQPGMSEATEDDVDREREIHAKFRESVINSGVRVVSGDSLSVHHRFANFFQENPFKILAGIGIPTVMYIFKGKAGQEHLATQMKIMHTRVMGQASVLIMLLSLMGFKEYMDRSGKYITERDVQDRIAQMQQSRSELMMRLQRDRMEAMKVAEKRRLAHKADVQAGLVKCGDEQSADDTVKRNEAAAMLEDAR